MNDPITTILQAAPMVQGGLTLMLAGWLGYQLRELPHRVISALRAWTTREIQVRDRSPLYDVLVSPSGSDLGRVGGDVDRLVAEAQAQAPKGVTLRVQGQYQSMTTSFAGLAWGLLASVVLVYFLMVVNFQSWTDPFIIIFAVPGALAGVVAVVGAPGESGEQLVGLDDALTGTCVPLSEVRCDTHRECLPSSWLVAMMASCRLG